LDIKAMLPAGGGPEFLTVSLVDPDDHDHLDAQGVCTLPPPDMPLGDSGLSVEDFLHHWRAGTTGLDSVARLYGQALHRQLLGNASPIHDAWQKGAGAARQGGQGLRLEIRCPLDSASRWMGQSLSALPFELLCDESGYLFRRAGWSTVRRTRELASRAMRFGAMANAPASVQVAWANVTQPGEQAMDEALFSAHDTAVQTLDKQGVIKRLPPLPGASRRALADCLAQHRPHILVWVGHGLASGSGLLLHDSDNPDYPTDCGQLVAASDFASAVRQGQVDVALLWSCHGAGTFRLLDVGVAEALLDPERGDVAAVLASFAALDATAVAKLSRDLVAAWGQAGNDLEAALARARSELDEASLTWARPVLFLRTPPASPAATLAPRLPALAPVQLGGSALRWLPQLPACTDHYVDHHQRLKRLSADVDAHPVVVLEGLSGAGKTELALALAHRQRALGNDVAFIDLSGQPSLAHLRQTLGLLVAEKPFDDDVSLLRALVGRKWLLVLDNAEDVLPDPVVRDDLLWLLAGLRATGSSFRAIVTSRHALAAPGTAGTELLFPRELKLLDAEESRILFVDAAGPRLAPQQAVPEVLDPLLTELGGVARAIVLMAGQLGGEVDVRVLQQRLAQIGPEAIAESRLYRVPVPAELDRHVHKTRLTSAFRLSLASAIRQAAMVDALFNVLGTLPGGLLQSLLPLENRTALSDALAALLDHHLVQLAGEQRRITMAAPVRAWARQRWQTETAPEGRSLLDAVQTRLAVYASHLDDALGTPNAQAARLQFLTESSNLIQLLQLRTDPLWPAEADRVAASVLRSVCLFAEHGGTARSMLPLIEPIALSHFERFSSTSDAASAMFYLANLKRRTADLAGARQAYEQALPIYRAIKARLGEANTLQSMGQLAWAEQHPRQAFALMLQVKDLQVAIDDRLGLGGTHGYLSGIAASVGALDQAVGLAGRAQAIFEQVDNHFGQMVVLHELGQVLSQAQPEFGVACLMQAQDFALSIGNPIAERLGRILDSLRPGDVSAEDFAASLAQKRLQAGDRVKAMFASAEAATAAGQLALYVLPERAAGSADAD